MIPAVAVTALLSTGIAGFFVRRVLIASDVIDRPNARSSHVTATPRGGGYACAVGVLMGIIVAGSWGTDRLIVVAVVAAILLAAVGGLDDQIGLPAPPRLLAQTSTGAIVGFVTGGSWPWALIGAAVFAVAVNIINFMDGINGITSGTMALWGAALGTVATLRGEFVPAVLAFAVLGAALGFLPWNWPRSHMFLGDVGSYLFGGLAAAGILTSAHEGVELAAVAVLPLGIYLADASWTLLRRAQRGAPLMEAHREHVYQRLVADHGWSHGQSAVAAVLGAAAMVLVGLMDLPAVVRAVAVACIGAAYLVLPRLLSIRRGRA